jgi:hypothetical protein
MLYPAWAALSTDEQFAFAARGTGPQHGGLGHARSHIRAARTAAGQSHSHPTLSKAWKAIDSKPANPAGFVECLEDYIGMACNVDALTESIDRAPHAIRLAQCHPAYAKPAKPTPAKVATPRPLDQGGGMAPVARPPLVSTRAHRRSIEAVTEPGPFRPCPDLVRILAPALEPCRHFAGVSGGLLDGIRFVGTCRVGLPGLSETSATSSLYSWLPSPAIRSMTSITTRKAHPWSTSRGSQRSRFMRSRRRTSSA